MVADLCFLWFHGIHSEWYWCWGLRSLCRQHHHTCVSRGWPHGSHDPPLQPAWAANKGRSSIPQLTMGRMAAPTCPKSPPGQSSLLALFCPPLWPGSEVLSLIELLTNKKEKYCIQLHFSDYNGEQWGVYLHAEWHACLYLLHRCTQFHLDLLTEHFRL